MLRNPICVGGEFYNVIGTNSTGLYVNWSGDAEAVLRFYRDCKSKTHWIDGKNSQPVVVWITPVIDMPAGITAELSEHAERTIEMVGSEYLRNKFPDAPYLEDYILDLNPLSVTLETLMKPRNQTIYDHDFKHSMRRKI